MTLVEFLLARIAEDETKARDAQADAMVGARWKRWPEDAYTEIQTMVLSSSRRALAECEAKRRIVERETERLREQWRARRDEHRETFDEWLRPPYGETLRILASVYADHPDYDEAWRP